MLVGGYSNSSRKRLDKLKPNFISNHHGIGEENYSNDRFSHNEALLILVICCSSFLYCQPPGAGAFSKDLTTTLVRIAGL